MIKTFAFALSISASPLSRGREDGERPLEDMMNTMFWGVGSEDRRTGVRYPRVDGEYDAK